MFIKFSTFHFYKLFLEIFALTLFVFAILQKFRCIDKTKSLNQEENKVGCSLVDEISDTVKRHHTHPSLTEKSSSFPKFHVGSELALLIGILTFQAHQQAIAATEFTHGLQSPSFFEDLGDINTGFASVRKASLGLCRNLLP